MVALKNMSRFQALAVHLGISLVIFIGLAWAVFYVWFPGIFFYSENGIRALVLIAGVDLILGPLLTFIVFNPQKKSLKMDLAIIAGIQISALLAGAYTLHTKRPVAIIVINPDTGLQTLYANQLDPETRSFIQSQPQTLYFYQVTQAPEVVDGKVSASDYAISQNNLVSYSAGRAQHTLKNFDFQKLPLDKGFKENIYLSLTTTGQLKPADQ